MHSPSWHLPPPNPTKKRKLIGTASIQECNEDDQHQEHESHQNETATAPHDIGQVGQQYDLPGGYKLAVFALTKNPRYHIKGLVKGLLKACEDEIRLRHTLTNEANAPPLRLVVRAVKETNGAYWLKQEFYPVGSRKFPRERGIHHSKLHCGRWLESCNRTSGWQSWH
ncbi:Acyl-CoA N-acyltransferase [Penicillium alfredii]|uniref:Acyl-CoA N-acyltransferase n=1 Tax=Penicillium alfredii TaxID=1506179 RepID=A0A9W9F0Y8_9EURO|nr:Acyl-CoA N-acyltransferase [Penicillium alfredii]KAJ5091476.1 Acyl-CoA N-acyltransferase [Penicillium alfredii]